MLFNQMISFGNEPSVYTFCKSRISFVWLFLKLGAGKVAENTWAVVYSWSRDMREWSEHQIHAQLACIRGNPEACFHQFHGIVLQFKLKEFHGFGNVKRSARIFTQSSGIRTVSGAAMLSQDIKWIFCLKQISRKCSAKNDLARLGQMGRAWFN